MCVCVCWVSFVAYRFYYIHFISFFFFVGEVVFIWNLINCETDF